MEITEIDKAENIAWISCPDYMQGNDEHDSYSIELTEKIEEMFNNNLKEDF